MSGSKVIVVGSSNTDLVLTFDRLPRPGETLLGGDFHQHQGGKGANQAVAAARAGAKVHFIGARGDDDFGTAAATALQSEGINVSHFIRKEKVASGVALILLGGECRENMIGVARSANDQLSAQDIRNASPAFKEAGALICQLETPLPTVSEAAKLAGARKIPFILNPAPAQILPASLLKKVYILTPNEHEACLMTGKRSAETAGKELIRLGCKHVVITLGAKGALYVSKSGVQNFSAPHVKPVDTVGAGDCFNGWLAASLVENLKMDEAIARAIRAASVSVTRSGAQSGMPYRAEVL
jgi:ribokinase